PSGGESAGAGVPIKVVGLVGEVGDEQIEPAVVIVISEVYAHRAKLLTIVAKRHAGEQSDFVKRAIVLVAVEEVWAGVVGHEQIRPAVVIVISPDCPEAITMFRIVNSSFLGNVFEGAIAAIMKQEIALAFHPPWPALHQHTFESAELLVAAELRKLVHVHMNVAGNEKINAPIAIIIAPRGAGAEAIHPHAGLRGDVLELAVAQALVEDAMAIAGDV